MSKEKIVISGREFTKEEIDDSIYIVKTFTSFSRKEIVKTICEGINWCAPNGKPKIDGGSKLLNYLEKEYNVDVPLSKKIKVKKSFNELDLTNKTEPGTEQRGVLSKYMPIELKVVKDKSSRKIWNGYIEKYHDEKYKRPFGSSLRYFIMSGNVKLGCLLFSASALALESRDKWIGWDKETRLKNLYLIINNTRFLIFPWVKIKYLASHVLSVAVKQVTKDWMEYYNFQPVLLETFINIDNHKGTCYKAANWQYLGKTKGRGRQDRYTKYLSSPKDIYVYPLIKDFRDYLTGEKDVIIGGDPDEM